METNKTDWTHTMHPSDEMLMAFADDELSAAEAEAVAAAVAADPALAERVRMFRDTRAALAGSAPAPQSDDDAALIALIRAAAVPAAAPLTNAAPRAVPANRNWRPAAIAASVAAAAVAAVWSMGLFGPTTGPTPDGALPPALTAALDAVPSGEGAVLAEGEFTAIATYRIADGSICREYERHGTAQTTIAAIACREDGTWRNRFATELGQSADGYVPASADTEGLDAALAGMGAGDPLTPGEETQALRALRP